LCGRFDGQRITIDPDVSFEMQCFLLLHLFGHSVQWVAPSLARTVDAIQNTSDRSHFLHGLRDYEPATFCAVARTFDLGDA
jgi:hypothetical protein